MRRITLLEPSKSYQGVTDERACIHYRAIPDPDSVRGGVGTTILVGDGGVGFVLCDCAGGRGARGRTGSMARSGIGSGARRRAPTVSVVWQRVADGGRGNAAAAVRAV